MLSPTFFLLAGLCFVVVTSLQQDLPFEKEELRAIQHRLARYEGLEKLLRTEEERDECLPEGAGCTFFGGLSCCGLRTRCIIFDTQVPQRGGPAKWLSICREYTGGVALDNVGTFFKDLTG